MAAARCDPTLALPDALCAALLCSFLPLRDRFYSLARVSRRWRQLAWRSIHGDRALDLTWCLGDSELDHVVGTLASVAGSNGSSKLEAFKLYGPRVDSLVLTRLVDGVGCTRIKCIEIESRHTDDAALASLTACTELTALALHCVKLTSSLLQQLARSCRKLRSLDLSGCSRVCDDGVIAVAAACDHLRELDLSMCHRISDRSIAQLGFRKPKTLMRVVVDRCLKISGLALRFLLRTQPLLTELSFANCPRVFDQDFTTLDKHVSRISHQLELVDMSGCAQLRGDGARALISRNAATLRSISARALVTLCEAAFSAIACCSQLIALDLSMCRTLRNADLDRIVSACQSLRSLKLQGCVQIDDDGATTIACHAAKLQTLSLEFCYNITDIGLTEIVAKCHKLEDLNLKALNQLTTDAFATLISLKSDVAALRRINIGACADFETTLRYASIIKRRYPRARIEWT